MICNACRTLCGGVGEGVGGAMVRVGAGRQRSAAALILAASIYNRGDNRGDNQHIIA